jgi:transcriptional regulator with XRE-family HTH domain
MSAFGEILKERRKALKLSREGFAKRAGVSPNYIISIEARGNRIPHRKTLFDIIRIAACRDEDRATNANAERRRPSWGEVDGEVVVRMLAAVDDSAQIDVKKDLRLRRHPKFDEELQEQHAEPTGSEVWIISDVLAEANDPEAARRTAQNISEKKMMYRFFVPFSSSDLHWKNAIDHLSAALGDSRRGFLEERVRVYRLSDCAFNCRVRISQPGTDTSQGRYNIGGVSGDEIELVPAPHSLMTWTAKNLGTLCERADAGWPSSDPHVGLIERVYPSPVAAGGQRRTAKRGRTRARRI